MMFVGRYVTTATLLLLFTSFTITPTDAACFAGGVLGGPDREQCYSVDLSFCSISDPNTTCTSSNGGYVYYSYNAVEADRDVYATLEWDARHGGICDNDNNDEYSSSCTIVVNDVECNACQYDSETDSIIMEDCSNTPGGFFPAIGPDGEPMEPLVLPLNTGDAGQAMGFFPLKDGDAAEEERCRPPVYAATNYPTASPPKSDSGDGDDNGDEPQLVNTNPQQCKIFMFVSDKDKNNLINLGPEYREWLNRLVFPNPLFESDGTFDDLPESLKNLYIRYAASFGANGQIDIAGARPGSTPLSPEQGASLDSLCAEAVTILSKILAGDDDPSDDTDDDTSHGVPPRPSNPEDYTVTVQASLEYDFFAGTMLREFTDDELDGLWDQTSLFYRGILTEAYPHLESYELIAVGSRFDDDDADSDDDAHPALIEFDIVITFDKETSFTPASPEQVELELKTADLFEYVFNYVWKSEPNGGLAFEIQRAFYNARDPTLTYPPLPSSAPSSSPTADGGGDSDSGDDTGDGSDVVAQAVMSFGFFQDTPLREPIQEEIEGALQQTTLFYEDVLGEIYPNLDSLELILVDTVYDPDQNEFPVSIEFDVLATFKVGADAPSEEELLTELGDLDYTDFIQSYLWANSPINESIFYEVQKTSFNPRQVDVPSMAPTVDIPGNLVLKSVLRFGLFDGVEVRDPTESELTVLFYTATIEFVNQLLRREFPNLGGFEPVLVGSSVDELADFPISVFFHLNFYDQGGTDPSEEELIAVFRNADYNEYIQTYVWNSGLGLFYDTQRVQYDTGIDATYTPYLLNSVVPSQVPIAPTYSNTPTYLPYSEVPSWDYTQTPSQPTETPTYATWVPSWDYTETPSQTETPTYATWVPSWDYTETPSQTVTPTYYDTSWPSLDVSEQDNSFSCFDDWAEGEVKGDKCYALDVGFCTETHSNGCTETGGTYQYYNQYTSSIGSTNELYASVFVSVKYNCDGGVGRENGCSISVSGTQCNSCTSEGATVTMVDCSNISEFVMTGTFAPTPQSLTMTEGGGSFAIIGTDEMCNHPSVGMQTDAGGSTPTTTPTTEESNTLVVPSQLRFKFANGKGTVLDQPLLTKLLTSTLEFLEILIMDDTSFGPIFLDLRLGSIEPEYNKEETPDEFDIKFEVHLFLEPKAEVTLLHAIETMANGDWNKYLSKYVRSRPHLFGGKKEKKTALHDIRKVTYRGIGTGHH